VFDDSDYLDNVLNQSNIKKIKFTKLMKANALYVEARKLSYSDFSFQMGLT
jgi:hypothetical protein